MSNNRQPPDSAYSQGGGRYRGSREWDRGYRDRAGGGGAGRAAQQTQGVVRNRARSQSADRGRHGVGPYSEGRGGYGRAAPAQRGSGYERDRFRGDHDRGGRYGGRMQGYDGGFHEPQARHYPRAGRSQDPFARGSRYHVPAYMRRNTEPSDSLEEGELDIDDRVSRRTSNPNAIPVAPRQFRSSREPPSPTQRRPPPGFRSEHRSPRPLATQEAAFTSQPAPGDRRRPSATGSAPRSTQPSRHNTPSPRRRTPLVESPENEEIRITDSQAPSGDEAEHLANAPVSSTTELPRRHLETRLSDIDREIAECQEKLVMISSTAAKPPPPLEGQSAQRRISNDRAVPTSPPVKTGALPSKPGHAAVKVIDGSGSVSADLAGTRPSRGAEKDELEHLAPVVPQVVSEIARASFSGAHGSSHSDGETEASGNESESDAGGFGLDSNSSSSSSSGEGDDDGCGHRSHHSKDNMRSLINGIYAENQRKAAEVQAAIAAPFLSAFPNFVPGSYPEPSDWPFWAENEQVHQRLKPFLTAILGREKTKRTAHARQLQEQYADLYAKWRKRVDKLDRQREAKHRTSANGASRFGSPGSAGSSSTNLAAAGTAAGAQFGSTFHRRRHGSGPSNPAVDEFGFSTGPLFTASATLAPAHEGGGRADDLFTSDAVHSEAELQAIIERLQYDDARNPDFRSQRTAAIIPDMVVDEKERAMLRFDNCSHKVEDPIAFYHVRMPEPGSSDYRRVAYGNNADADHYWTQAEVSAFVAAYLAHPKQFGKIASYIPHKSMNDCVLFYYRNKKPLRLKALEAKSSKRARRSRQASSSSGGGRKRKERAKERRERRAREEREKMAMEAAAECAPIDFAVDTVCSTPLDDGLGSNARNSALPSDDETTNADASDILEQRTRSNALLRSIIAANRQRKGVTSASASASASTNPLDARGSLGISVQAAVLARSPPSPLPPRSPSAVDTDAVAASAHSHEQVAQPEALVSPASPPRRADMNAEKSLTSPQTERALLMSSPPSVPASLALSTQADSAASGKAGHQQPQPMEADEDPEDLEDGDDDDDNDDDNDDDDDADNDNDDDDDNEDDEEEGELVEDSRWEPHQSRTSRAKTQRELSELNAYAMGGSIVRTRRTRELDEDPQSTPTTDDEDTALYMRAAAAEAVPTDMMDVAVEEEEIVEASGVVADRSHAMLLLPPSAPPHVISRKSSSRFGATLTTIVDSSATGAAAAAVTAAAGDAAKRPDVRPRSLSPVRSSAEQSPPKESALDRFVTEEPSVLQRAISSYETLQMCGNGVPPGSSLAEAKTAGIAERIPSLNFVAAHRATSGQTSTSAPLLDTLIDELGGPEDKVLVGAAVWAREDRLRVLRAFCKFGDDFPQVASLMPTKTMPQCRYFYFHYRTPGGKMVSEVLSIASDSRTGTSLTSKPLASASSALASIPLMLPNAHASAKQKTAKAKSTSSRAPPVLQPLVLPPSSSDSKTEHAAKRQRITAAAEQRTHQQPHPVRSTVNSDDDDDDDDDDETPLAAQLAEVLAAQGAGDAALLAASRRSSPTLLASAGLPASRATSVSSRPLSAVAHQHATQSQQQQQQQQQRRRMSDIAQVRPELIGAQSQTVSSLVLPSKPISKSPVSAGGAFALPPQPAQAVESPTGVAHHGPLRTPSPAASGAMTAKKSGYSSYWSVHERSAFLHYAARLGSDWAAIAEAIGSKTATQARNYFRTNREKLKLDAVIAEFERNKAAGTVPAMTPYIVPGAGSTHGTSGAADVPGAASRKEKRGRKRKAESRTSPAVPENMPLAMSLAVNQPHHDPAAAVASAAAAAAAQPITAPATLTSIPTIGVDGGRAVVVARPSVAVPSPSLGQDAPHSAGATGVQRYPPAQLPAAHTFHHLPPASATPIQPSRPMWTSQQQAQQPHSLQSQQSQQPQQSQLQSQPKHRPVTPTFAQPQPSQQPQPQPQHQPAYSLPPLMVPGHDMADRYPVITHRGESDTPSSQPTPPPVEGLPRFSSSPAPTMQQRPRMSSPLHRISATRTYNPVSLPPHPQSALNIASITNSEPRKMSVTKINALLNDDEPPLPTSKRQDPISALQKPAASNEDEATGMAALALASMMEAGRPESAKPQPPLPSSSNRPSDPMTLNIAVSTSRTSSSQPMQPTPVSAFRPVHHRSPPIVSPRPASAGPGGFQARLTSPVRSHPNHQPPQMPMYQSAPPRTSTGYLPPPSSSRPMASEGIQRNTVLPPIMAHSPPPPPLPSHSSSQHHQHQQQQQHVIGRSPQVPQMHSQMPPRQSTYMPPASQPQTYPMSAPMHTSAPPAHPHYYMQQPQLQQRPPQMPMPIQMVHQRPSIGHQQGLPPQHQQRYPPQPQPPQQPYSDHQQYQDQQRPR